VSEALAGTILLALLFLFFSLGLEIAFSLGLVGLLGLLWLKGWTVGLGVVGSVAWSNASSYSFVAVPLFVFMSAILLHSDRPVAHAAVARGWGFSPGGLRWRAWGPAPSSRRCRARAWPPPPPSA
jgi:hypothetical protein